MSDDTPLAESEIETDRLPWCIVVPIKDKDTGREYSDPDIVGLFATYAEAKLWLDTRAHHIAEKLMQLFHWVTLLG